MLAVSEWPFDATPHNAKELAWQGFPGAFFAALHLQSLMYMGLTLQHSVLQAMYSFCARFCACVFLRSTYDMGDVYHGIGTFYLLVCFTCEATSLLRQLMGLSGQRFTHRLRASVGASLICRFVAPCQLGRFDSPAKPRIQLHNVRNCSAATSLVPHFLLLLTLPLTKEAVPFALG